MHIRVRNVDLFPVRDDAAINRTGQAVNRQNVDKAVPSGQVIATVQQGQARNIRARRNCHNIRAVTHRDVTSDHAGCVQIGHVIAIPGRDATQKSAIDGHRRIASIIYNTSSTAGAINRCICANINCAGATRERYSVDASAKTSTTSNCRRASDIDVVGRNRLCYRCTNTIRVLAV